MGRPTIGVAGGGMGVASVSACAGDLDGSGLVDADDLQLLLEARGPSAGGPGDLDGDDRVGPGDVIELLGALGMCPQE